MLVTPEQVANALRHVHKRRTFTPGHTPSAVLVILFNCNGETHIVYTRRTRTMRVHSGNMAFPGGKIDPEDESSYAAAVRETLEEIGLDQGDYNYLGHMGNFETLTSKFDAVTHLVWSPKVPQYSINHAEVEEVVEIPLEILMRQYRPDLDFEDEHEVMYLNFTYRGATLWGLTARITHHLVAGLTDYLQVC